MHQKLRQMPKQVHNSPIEPCISTSLARLLHHSLLLPCDNIKCVTSKLHYALSCYTHTHTQHTDTFVIDFTLFFPVPSDANDRLSLLLLDSFTFVPVHCVCVRVVFYYSNVVVNLNGFSSIFVVVSEAIWAVFFLIVPSRCCCSCLSCSFFRHFT